MCKLNSVFLNIGMTYAGRLLSLVVNIIPKPDQFHMLQGIIILIELEWLILHC